MLSVPILPPRIPHNAPAGASSAPAGPDRPRRPPRLISPSRAGGGRPGARPTRRAGRRARSPKPARRFRALPPSVVPQGDRQGETGDEQPPAPPRQRPEPQGGDAQEHEPDEHAPEPQPQRPIEERRSGSAASQGEEGKREAREQERRARESRRKARTSQPSVSQRLPGVEAREPPSVPARARTYSTSSNGSASKASGPRPVTVVAAKTPNAIHAAPASTAPEAPNRMRSIEDTCYAILRPKLRQIEGARTPPPPQTVLGIFPNSTLP